MDVRKSSNFIVFGIYFVLFTIIIAVTNNQKLLVFGFNIDTEHVLELSPQPDSWFGYSVAMHRGLERNWIVVGAPRQNVSTQSPGTVYRCSLDETCESIVPTHLIDDEYDGLNVLNNKSSQMLGATVTSGTLDNQSTLLICAPNFVHFLHKFYINPTTVKVQRDSNLVKREVTGTCYYSTDDFQTFHIWSPVMDKIMHEWGDQGYGVAQLGFSAVVSPNGLLAGAPGATYSTGRVFTTLKMNDITGGDSTSDYSYLGYSIAAGKQTVAIGEPNGNELYGSVLTFLFNNPERRSILKGKTFGSYFGYAVAVGDVTGDGLEDILVGAPQYSTKIKGEIGQVVLFRRESNSWKSTAIFGHDQYSRFGTSIAVLGDLNYDGVNDFAVGAPFGANYGVVYIFHGSRLLQNRKPVQVLTAGPVPSFGFSIAGTLDLDNNLYTDLVIGAPLTNQVFVYRTRSIVDLRTKLKFPKGTSIELGSKKCGQLDCAEFSTCLSYRGRSVQSSLTVKVTWDLDVTKKVSRLKLKDAKEEIVTLKKREEACINQTVFVLENITDIHTPFQISASFSLVPEENSNNLEPMLNFTSSTKASGVLYIANDCANRFMCIPDLKLKVLPNQLQYTYGSQALIPLELELRNTGERAFETKLSIQLLPGFSYQSISAQRENQTVKVDCSPPRDFNEFTLTCGVGNPVLKGQGLNLTMLLQPEFMKLESSIYTIAISINSSNFENETTILDNFQEVYVNIDYDVDLKISGISQPDPHTFYILSSDQLVPAPSEGILEEKLGPSIFHAYFIYNAGTSPVKEAVITVEIPSKILELDFLYIVDFKSSPTLLCDLNFVNPSQVKVARETKLALARLDQPVALRQIQEFADSLIHSDPDSQTKKKRKKREQDQLSLFNKTYFRCKLQDFESRGEAFLAFSFRLVTETFKKIHDGSALISTLAKVDVTDMYLVANMTQSWVESKLELKTLLLPAPVKVTVDPPLWIVVVAATGGMAVFILLVLIMWKCGFFKRRRPPTEEELKLTQYALYIHNVYSKQIENPIDCKKLT